MARIFISYSRKDERYLKLLIPQLENVYGSGSCWYDSGLSGGDEWWQSILSQIESCHVFVFLMSDHSIDSKPCQNEIKKALQHTKPVLQVLLPSLTVAYEHSLPSDLHEQLSKLQYVHLGHQFDETLGIYRDLSRLWGALNSLLTYSRRPLSTTDRLVLYNQIEILEKLHDLQKRVAHLHDADKINDSNEEDDDQKNYRTSKEILRRGYERYYGDIADHIYEQVFPYASATEVVDILDMLSSLKYASERLEDKEGMPATEIAFHGFAGNQETAEMQFARFMMEDMEGFEELRPKKLEQYNSHFPMLPIYRRMLLVWNACSDKNNLSEQDIQRIAEARSPTKKQTLED